MAELLKKVFDLDNNKLSLWLSWWCVAGILTSWQIEFVNSRVSRQTEIIIYINEI